MADPIAIAEKIVNVALFIHGVVDSVKAFPKYAQKLDFKIQLMKPSLDTLVSMKAQRQQLQDACKRESQLHLFEDSLSKMLACINEVEAFISDIKDMDTLKRIRKKNVVTEKFEELQWKLDELQKSIQFGVITEVRKEVEANQKADKVQTLIKHVRNSGAFNATSGRPVPERNEPAKTKGIHRSPGAESLPFLSLEDIDLKDPLGEGGFSSVWFAKDSHGQDVAVKIFDVSNNKLLLQEARKMQRVINSPYIVHLVGVIDEPECQAIVMDYFENGSLKSFLKYLDCDCWPRRIRMLCDVAIGVNYLHHLTPPIIHKDLKACNIFIDHGMKAKLGDFGLSVSSTKEYFGSTPNSTKSQAVIVGTVSHIPPEAWAGTVKKATKPWDIYEFGITLYEFTSGLSPWPSYATPEMIRGWVYTDNKRPDDINEKDIKDSTPTEIIKLTKRCWKTDPNERPTSEDILHDLTDLFERNYKDGLNKADMAILEQKETLHGNSEPRGADSGVGSGIMASFGSMTVQRVATNASYDMSSASHFTSRDDWNLAQEFGREGDGEGEFRMARRIAAFDNGVTAVVDFNCHANLSRVYFFNVVGTYKTTLQSNTSNPTEKLIVPTDVAITSTQNMVVVDQSHFAKVFNSHGSFIHSISTLTPGEDPSTWVNTAMQVSVNCNDDIVIGNTHRQLLTVHREADKWLPRKIKLDIKPIFMSTNMRGQILVTGKKEQGKFHVVKVLDMSGQEVVSIDTFMVDGNVGSPQGLVCDERGCMYIAVMQFDERRDKIFFDTGHIHQYDKRGIFMKCIIKNIHRPKGLAMSNTGSNLYVANDKAVLKYSAT